MKLGIPNFVLYYAVGRRKCSACSV